jgi:hypothetical protein
MAALADAAERECRGIPQWTHTLEPRNRLAKVNCKRLIVCPPQAQRLAGSWAIPDKERHDAVALNLFAAIR